MIKFHNIVVCWFDVVFVGSPSGEVWDAAVAAGGATTVVAGDTTVVAGDAMETEADAGDAEERKENSQPQYCWL